MLFNSIAYLIFLPLVVALFWALPRRARVPLLLVASYVFYMFWKAIYGWLIFALSLANYLIGLLLAASGVHKTKVLVAGIALNLLTLGFFKYAYFTRNVAQSVASKFGSHIPSITCEIILPLGISFFVFEFIHYLVEVHKGGKPVRSFFDFALFASFFPTQIAGPIKRYQDFIPQLYAEHKLTREDLDQGIELILFGLAKKVLLADNMAPVVQAAFAHPQLLTCADLWVAAAMFSFQLYFDFSGYTDIARGSARLLGFKVPLNFDLPYMAGSIAEFWRRWHISLSTWLRDYLFVPLGGSKGGRIFTCRNLLITMVLGGLWHGAAPHYVLWGAYHGMLLVVHRLWSQSVSSRAWFQHMSQTALYRAFSIAATFQLVTLGLVIFRATGIGAALYMVQRMLLLEPSAPGLQPWQLSLPNASIHPTFLLTPVLLLLLLLGQLLGNKFRTTYGIMPLPGRWKAVYLAALAAILLVWSPDATPTFIYFQF